MWQARQDVRRRSGGEINVTMAGDGAASSIAPVSRLTSSVACSAYPSRTRPSHSIHAALTQVGPRQ